MVRSSLIVLAVLTASTWQAQGVVKAQAAHGGIGGVGGVGGGLGAPNGNGQAVGAAVLGILGSGQMNRGIGQNGGWVQGSNNGFGYYTPAFAVGGLGGLGGLSYGYGYGLNSGYGYNYGYGYGLNYGALIGTYGANAGNALLLNRTMTTAGYYGDDFGGTIPYGVNNLYGMLPNAQGQANRRNLPPQEFSGPKTNPGIGVTGETEGNADAAAILNGAVPNRMNPKNAKANAVNKRRGGVAKGKRGR